MPSFFMLVPAPWRDSQEVIRALRIRGIDASPSEDRAIRAGEYRVEIVEDAELAAGFSSVRNDALSDELISRIARCGSAALVEAGHRLDESPAEIAKLGRALRDAGGVAVRMEASGAASAWEPWLKRLESGAAFDVYACSTLIVEGDRGELFTCGMHQFELPDAQIELGDASEAEDWLEAFCVYQIEGRPALASGHTFRPSSGVAKRSFERWPDHRHQVGDGRYNPFGIWRFLQPGAKAIEPSGLLLVFMPSLAATLFAAEQSEGRPLTRVAVENLVESSHVVAMTPTDALAVERSRGYADIEPERAWEQWQIVRSPRLTLVR